MRESTIERYLVKKVKEAGGTSYKFVSPGRRNVPDRIVVFPWRKLFFVETKSSSGRLRPGQKREHARLKADGFTVWVVSSRDMVDAFVCTIANLP